MANLLIPSIHTDTHEPINDTMREFYFASTIINSTIHDFTAKTIKKKSLKGVSGKVKTLTPKQVYLLAWVYVFNRKGVNTYHTPTLCEHIEEAQGVKFIQNPHDLSVWFTDIGKDYIVRDNENKKTELCEYYTKLLDACFKKKEFTLTIKL